MGISPKIKRYVVRILVLAFIISVGLNLYDHFVTFPKMLATTNNMRVHALWEWKSRMMSVKNILKNVETNLPVYDAWIQALFAEKFVQIYGIEIEYNSDNLYYWLSLSSYRLEQAIYDIYYGKEPGPVTSEDLDEYVLQKIGNITQAIEGIENSMIVYANGVDPAQQLLEIGNLTNTMDYCNHIAEASREITIYY